MKKEEFFEEMIEDLYPNCGKVRRFWELFVYQFSYEANKEDITTLAPKPTEDV